MRVVREVWLSSRASVLVTATIIAQEKKVLIMLRFVCFCILEVKIIILISWISNHKLFVET